jgi:hypothetical protein
VILVARQAVEHRRRAVATTAILQIRIHKLQGWIVHVNCNTHHALRVFVRAHFVTSRCDPCIILTALQDGRICVFLYHQNVHQIYHRLLTCPYFTVFCGN